MKFSNKFKYLLATPLFALASNAALSQETIILKFSHLTSANSNLQVGVVEPWCNAIAKDSGGRLKCQIYPSMQLGGTPAQLADQVKNGVADIVWTAPSYTTGRFPRTEALELPFTIPPTALEGTKAMWEYTEKYGRDDFKDYKLLALWSSSNLIISTVSKPILTADSIKG
jgi:TRAP-type C4-dicarboxylate transport system substrate-binding protein